MPVSTPVGSASVVATTLSVVPPPGAPMSIQVIHGRHFRRPGLIGAAPVPRPHYPALNATDVGVRAAPFTTQQSRILRSHVPTNRVGGAGGRIGRSRLFASLDEGLAQRLEISNLPIDVDQS